MKTKLIPCKACGKSIAKNAATCPYCGKSSTSLARIGLLALLVVLILWFLGGGSIVMDELNRNRQINAAEERLERLRARGEIPEQ